MAERRLLFVVPWTSSDPADRWLWNHLPAGSACGEIVSAAPDHGPGGPGRSRLPPYVREVVHLARRRPRLDRYDVVFAWELRCALASALFLGRRTGSKPLLVAVGPILKGGILRALPLVRLLLARAERIVCFSSAECDDNARLLRLPRERFLFVPTPIAVEDAPVPTEGDFALALGRSNRDYPTLLQAVDGTGIPLIVVAGGPGDLGAAPLPEEATARFNTGFHETNSLIAGARLHVVPLRPAGFSSGQTVLLRAMACGKACLVSDIPGIRDYVRPGETALLVPPSDPGALRAALVALWNDPQARRRIGDTAARAVRDEFGFPRFAQRLLELAEEVTPC